MMNKTLLLSAAIVALAGAPALAQSADLPPSASAGQCFARVLVPEQVEVTSEVIVDQPERTEVIIIPGEYADVEETIVVKEAQTVIEVIPATYRTVTETIVVTPERTEMVPVAEQTETYTEQVMIREGYTTWKPGAGLFGRGTAGRTGDGTEVSTGELLCKVEVPPEFRPVTRTRVVRPASSTARAIPAVTQTVSRQVIDQAARTVERVIPAETRSVRVRKEVTPPREEIRVIPATTRTVEKRVVSGGGGLQWREVLCETNTTTAKISEIQRALTAAGFNARVDGTFGADTLRAMEAFQRARGLPVGNLTIDTVRALGVTP
jgi:hypothetical protein